METLGFSIQSIMSSTNSDPFPICINIISVSCLIAVTRTSNIMLNRNSVNRLPFPVSEFSGKAFSFSLLSIMLAVGLS